MQPKSKKKGASPGIFAIASPGEHAQDVDMDVGESVSQLEDKVKKEDNQKKSPQRAKTEPDLQDKRDQKTNLQSHEQVIRTQ